MARRKMAKRQVSADAYFQFVASRIHQTANDTEAGIKLFIPMFSAILGGCIWLRLQLRGIIAESVRVSVERSRPTTHRRLRLHRSR